ncbi:hypothetical protein HYX17_02770 [Candidatus Woesearchaeota archaeon]|nr:hypothetical protein [Candidatus Woesearchaeota archaeon]
MKEQDFEKLEGIKVSFGKTALSPKSMYCDKCDIKMIKSAIEMPVSDYIKVKLNIFKCPKCREQIIGLDEAKKLDEALIINRLLTKENALSFKRHLSFDGNNYIFRLPSELTKGKHKEVKITPIESNEALIEW